MKPHWLKEIIIPDFFGKEFRWENLGQVNILVGANNSGKTTVLDWIWDNVYLKKNHTYPYSWSFIPQHSSSYEYANYTAEGMLNHMILRAKTSDILIIDLIEKQFDLATQRSIIDKLLEVNPDVQLFITTHSPAVTNRRYYLESNIQHLIQDFDSTHPVLLRG